MSAKTVSRARGQSAVHACAYRRGIKLRDERTGVVKSYTKKGEENVLHAHMCLPPGADPRLKNPGFLWNQAEHAEKRKDAKTAREFEIALPYELKLRDQIKLSRKIGQHIANRYGIAADVCVHDHGKGDFRNRHVHILTTTRAVADTDSYKSGQKIRILDSPKTSGKEIESIRQDVAQITNDYLRRAQVNASVDNKSYARRGIKKKAGKHKGPALSAMIRKRGQGSLDRTSPPQKTSAHARSITRKQVNDARKEVEAAEKELEAMSYGNRDSVDNMPEPPPHPGFDDFERAEPAYEPPEADKTGKSGKSGKSGQTAPVDPEAESRRRDKMMRDNEEELRRKISKLFETKKEDKEEKDAVKADLIETLARMVINMFRKYFGLPPIPTFVAYSKDAEENNTIKNAGEDKLFERWAAARHEITESVSDYTRDKYNEVDSDNIERGVARFLDVIETKMFPGVGHPTPENPVPNNPFDSGNQPKNGNPAPQNTAQMPQNMQMPKPKTGKSDYEP